MKEKVQSRKTTDNKDLIEISSWEKEHNRYERTKLKIAETGQQSPSCRVGNLVADEGKPTAGI